MNQQKSQNQKKNEDHEQVWGNPHSDKPECLQEFRENLVDERVPEHRDSHASFSHEPSLEPVRSVDLGKHSVYNHFPKDRNCEICQRTKSQGLRAEDVLAESYIVQKILVIWSQPITKFSVKDVNLETIIDTQSWCKTWLPNGCSRIRAKLKLLRKQKRACKSSWSRQGNLKVIYTDNSLEFGKACEDLSWNHCTSTPHRSQTNGIAERAVRRVKEGTSAVLLQSGLNEKIGGRIPWNATLICETFKISCLMGRLHMKDALENLFRDQLSRFGSLVWELPYLCEKPVKNPWWNLEGWHNGCKTLRSWKRWPHRESTQKDSMQRK